MSKGQRLFTVVVWQLFGSIVAGWALSMLWNWFLVRAYDLPMMTLPVGIGVNLFVGLATFRAERPYPEGTDLDHIMFHILAQDAIAVTTALLLGWLFQAWVR